MDAKRLTACSQLWRCEYVSARAQKLSHTRRSESRKGIDRTQQQMEWAMTQIRDDLARGLSPCQIAYGRAKELKASPSTIYRWIDRGYCGLSSLELRRKVGYRPRSHTKTSVPTAHGKHRSFETFMSLNKEIRASACEMDTVIGRKLDRQCVLTLYLRPSKLQLALLLPGKLSSEVARIFDHLEDLIGKKTFAKLFGLILTDNGFEFHHTRIIEHSKLGGTRRTNVYYCDVRQSQQKAECERNHVELRKLLPKGAFAFDALERRDLAVVMSHLNSQPRPSLGGLCPISLFEAQAGDDALRLLEGLGVERIPYNKLDLTENAINIDRIRRGAEPLIRA